MEPEARYQFAHTQRHDYEPQRAAPQPRIVHLIVKIHYCKKTAPHSSHERERWLKTKDKLTMPSAV